MTWPLSFLGFIVVSDDKQQEKYLIFFTESGKMNISNLLRKLRALHSLQTASGNKQQRESGLKIIYE